MRKTSSGDYTMRDHWFYATIETRDCLVSGRVSPSGAVLFVPERVTDLYTGEDITDWVYSVSVFSEGLLTYLDRRARQELVPEDSCNGKPADFQAGLIGDEG